MKIAIIGYSGAGKSTFAKAIAQYYDIPCLYLDKVHWLPGWQERAREESKEIVRKFMENDNWTIDGNYNALYLDDRLGQADIIYLFNLNRFSCLRYAAERNKTYRGRTRESRADGCEEKIDSEFLWWLIWSGRSAKKRAEFKNITNKYNDKVVQFKSRRQVNAYLKKLGIVIDK